VCAERTPVLARVVPAFESVLNTWQTMSSNPEKQYLHGMLRAGIDKMKMQYNSQRYVKAFIISIGGFDWFLEVTVN
jgi:hypothetical protein